MRILAFAGKMGSGKDTAASFLLEKGFVRVALADEMKRLARPIFDLSDETLFGPSEKRNAEFFTPPSYWDAVHVRVDEKRTWIDALFEGAPPMDKDPVTWMHSVIDQHMRGEKCSARTILQKMGTEWGREGLWENVWIAQVLRVYEQLSIGGWFYTSENGLKLANRPEFKYHGVCVTDARFINEMDAVRAKGGKVYWIHSARRQSISMPAVLEKNAKHPSEPDFEKIADHVDKLLPNNGTIEQFRQDVLYYCGEAQTGAFRALKV